MPTFVSARRAAVRRAAVRRAAARRAAASLLSSSSSLVVALLYVQAAAERKTHSR